MSKSPGLPENSQKLGSQGKKSLELKSNPISENAQQKKARKQEEDPEADDDMISIYSDRVQACKSNECR